MRTGCFTRRTGLAWEEIAIETVIETRASRPPAMHLSQTWHNPRIPDIQIARDRRDVIFPAVISMDREDRQKRWICLDVPENAQMHACRDAPENAESQGPGDQEGNLVRRGAPENGERLAPKGREGNPVRRGVPESGGRLALRVSPGLRGRREQQAPRDPGETLAHGGRQVRPVIRKTVSLRPF